MTAGDSTSPGSALMLASRGPHGQLFDVVLLGQLGKLEERWRVVHSQRGLDANKAHDELCKRTNCQQSLHDVETSQELGGKGR